MRKRTMKCKLILGVLLAVLVCSRSIQAQSSTSRAVGNTPGTALASEAEGGGDYIGGSLSLATSYTDNVLLSSTHPIGDVDYAIQPGFSFAKTLGWLSTTWNFSPGLVKYQKIDQRDRLTGAIVTDIDARPAEHLSIRIHNNYRVRTSPPFDTFTTEPPSTFFGGEGGGTILPLAEQISEEGNVDVSYQPTADTTLQVSGSFRDYIYNPIQGVENSSLVNSESEAGRVQFYRRLSERAYLGAAYSLDNISFAFKNHGAGVISHSLVGTTTIDFTPSMQLQVFAGPEYSIVHNQLLVNLGLVNVFVPVTEDVLSATGGVIYTLHKDRSSLQFAAVRQVSGGTGLTAGAHSTKVDLTARRELGSHWYVALSAEYGLFTPLGDSATSFDIHAISARAALNHRITQNVSIEGDYSHGHQQQSSEALRRLVNVDFAMISIKYNIKRPL
jgi:hypothetical protein